MDQFLSKFHFHIPFWDIFFRIALAIFLGAILGFEREKASKVAGIRTHTLVSLGSATYVILALEIMFSYTIKQSSLDPGRVIQGIITGIGFLGAGSIMQSERTIHGLTTAANIWLIGAIGATCGFGLYGLAVLTTFAGLIVLTVFRKLRKFRK